MTTPSDHPLREARVEFTACAELIAVLLTLRLAVERPEYDSDPILVAARRAADAVLKKVGA